MLILPENRAGIRADKLAKYIAGKWCDGLEPGAAQAQQLKPLEQPAPLNFAKLGPAALFIDLHTAVFA
jgi:hypothetical protein